MCGIIGSTIGLFGMHYWQIYQGINPAAKHKDLAITKKQRKLVILIAMNKWKSGIKKQD
ncbi:MAG: hypothetical protein MRQ07_05420 [Candidatus Midichloria sp.]|nr:hypothetical protein [Candidatus Midichloria sp.]